MRYLLALLPAVCACQPDLGHDARPIYLGEPDDNPSVVALTWGLEYGYFCSGTLIAPDVVLTAGHCVEGEVASEVEIFFGHNANTGDGVFVAAAELVPHPDYDNRELTGDIAMVVLASPAPAGARPAPYLPASLGLGAADIGAAVDYSGFGITETGSEGVKLRVGGAITDVCASGGPCDDSAMVPGSFAYDMDTGGPCTGDSGGPTFMERGGVRYVVGVTSYGDADCLEWGVNTSVSDYAAWIAELAGEPTLPDDEGEDPGDPDGSDDGGCGCQTERGAGGAWLLALIAAASWRRRRRRRYEIL